MFWLVLKTVSCTISFWECGSVFKVILHLLYGSLVMFLMICIKFEWSVYLIVLIPVVLSASQFCHGLVPIFFSILWNDIPWDIIKLYRGLNFIYLFIYFNLDFLNIWLWKPLVLLWRSLPTAESPTVFTPLNIGIACYSRDA